MSLTAQMEWVERLMRHPERLDEAAHLPGEDGQVLASVDRDRLAAVSASYFGRVVGRWWEPRFPATVAVLGAQDLGVEVMRSAWFESARGEDVDARALVNGLLDAVEADRLEAPGWLWELAGFEYVLNVGLPRRQSGDSCDLATEARLLGDHVSWLEGGRLARPLVACWWRWPVSEIHERLVVEGEPPPVLEAGALKAWLVSLSGDEVLEVEASDVLVDSLSLLADGAADAAICEVMGNDGEELLAWLVELGLLEVS